MTPIATLDYRIPGLVARWHETPGAAMTLQQARSAYDRGEIEMVQGREGPVITQYVIQRKRKAESRTWFQIIRHGDFFTGGPSRGQTAGRRAG